MSDLDADNISLRMRTQNLSFFQAANAYYADIANDQTLRPIEFENNHTYDTIRDQVLEKSGSKSLEKLEKDYPEAYDFLMSVKNHDTHMTDYT